MRREGEYFLPVSSANVKVRSAVAVRQLQFAKTRIMTDILHQEQAAKATGSVETGADPPLRLSLRNNWPG